MPSRAFIAGATGLIGSNLASEEENIAANGALGRNGLAALDRSGSLRDVALATGLKHYLGPFEYYAKVKPDTPLREEMPRLPIASACGAHLASPGWHGETSNDSPSTPPDSCGSCRHPWCRRRPSWQREQK